ncbi:hypothetical protein EZS27_026878 [termite gut metagenome]|uniref:Uncharacterized protein n=1 Tax=termite gut metagenome TaxID=433724 RepID=A0A5J4QR00_9ZZZZ
MIKKKFKLLQVFVDRCVAHDYDQLREALSMKMYYLSGKQRPDYIRKEIFRITEELVAMNQKVPALQTVAFDWNIPGFIWESSFYETLTLPERRKYIAFPYKDFDDKQYIENPASYDEELPYLSLIIKTVVYSKYLEDLQKEEKELLHLQAATNTVTVSKEDIPSKKIVGKDNPFNCKLDGDAIRLLTDCANDARIFTTEITPQLLENFLYCRLEGALKSENNRLLAYFMTQLSLRRYITYEWQSVIANHKLILAPKKEKYLNTSDLSTANDNIKYIAPKKSEIIDKYVKELKKH